MRSLLFICFLVFSVSIFATDYTYTGTIHTLRDNVLAPDGDFMMINGFAGAGDCPVSGSAGLVIIRIPDSAARSFSIALSAQVAGKEVSLRVDDDITGVGGHCVLRWINIAG